MFCEDDSAPSATRISPYCQAIDTLDDLRAAYNALRTRVIAPALGEGDEELRTSPIASMIHSYLNSAMPGDSGARTRSTEDGHFVQFMQLLAPLPRDKSRRLQHQDEAAHGRPLVVAVLLPEIAFELSEVEAAYEFSVELSIEEQFGEGAMGHILVHDDVPFIDLSATFSVLLQNHPALLIGLSYGTVFSTSDYNTRLLRATLRTLSEILGTFHQGRVDPTILGSVIGDAGVAIRDIMQPPTDMPPSGGPHEETRAYLMHVLYEAFDTLLTEEVMIFDRIYERMTASMDEGVIEDSPREEEEYEDPEMDILRYDLARSMRHAIRRSRRRINALRRAIPSEDLQ